MKSSQILSKGIKTTVFSECVCSGTSCCCWILHKMFFWASEIVSFILLRWLQKFQRRKNTFRSLRSADILGDFSIFWWLMSSWESFILQKNTHLMVPAFQKSRIPFSYHWNIFKFLTVCVQINWIQRRPLGVQEIVMSFVQNHYLTFQSLNSRVTQPKDIKHLSSFIFFSICANVVNIFQEKNVLLFFSCCFHSIFLHTKTFFFPAEFF